MLFFKAQRVSKFSRIIKIMYYIVSLRNHKMSTPSKVNLHVDINREDLFLLTFTIETYFKLITHSRFTLLLETKGLITISYL